MLWLVLLVLSLLVIGALAYPLFARTIRRSPERIDSDLSVSRAPRAVVAIIALGVPCAAVVLYAVVGSSRPAGQPQAAEVQRGPLLEMTTSPDPLARQMRTSPTAAGYRRLANLYFAASKFEQAADADHHAMDLGEDDAGLWSEFGEAIVMTGAGSVPPQAMVAFVKALERDPHDPRSRFYIGLAEAEIGNLRQAVSIWRDLERDSDANAPWLAMMRQHIVAVAKQGGFDPVSAPAAPPSLDALRSAVATMQVATRQTQPEADTRPTPTMAGATSSQDLAVRGMVAGLAARMEQNSGAEDGWRRRDEASTKARQP